MTSQPWTEFAIDVGGTFTDCIARGPDGRVLRLVIETPGGGYGG